MNKVKQDITKQRWRLIQRGKTETPGVTYKPCP